MINMALEAFVPKMDQQVEAFVIGQIPAEISYSLSDFAGQGDGIDQQLEDLREKVIEGIRFTQDDLVGIIAGSDDLEALDEAEKKLTMLAEGVVITEMDIESPNSGSVERVMSTSPPALSTVVLDVSAICSPLL